MIGNCPDYCNPQFHYDPHLQTKWKFEISTIITLTSGEFKILIEQELKQNWTEKKMYGQFVRKMPENVDKNKTWQWFIQM